MSVSLQLKPAFCGLLLFCSVAKANDALRDFDTLWQTVAERYAFFDEPGIAERWSCVREKLRPRMRDATPEAGAAALHEALAALTDFQATLQANETSAWRQVPQDADIRARIDAADKVWVSDVRALSPAMRMGVRPGDEIVSVNSVGILQALRAHLPTCVNASIPAAQNWALQRIISGKNGNPRVIEIRKPDGRLRTLYLAAPSDEKIRIAARRLPDGVVVIPISGLGDAAALKRFNATVQRNPSARAFILDLREAASHEEGAEAAILGRWIGHEASYLKAVSRDNSSQSLSAKPVGTSAISQPVAVVVGPWTAGAGERLALGLHALTAAPVVGVRMAGMRGATETFTLPASGRKFSIPTQRFFHLDSTPLEVFSPTTSAKNDYGTDLVFREAVQALALPPMPLVEGAK